MTEELQGVTTQREGCAFPTTRRTCDLLVRRHARHEWPGDLQQKITGTPHALPIVFITGHGTVKVRAAAMSAGCVTVLDKPVEETALLAIERALALSSDPAPTRP